MTGNGSAQSLARLFADFGGFGKLNPGVLGRGENGSGQRMLRVALQARHEGQHFLLCRNPVATSCSVSFGSP